MAFRFKVEDFKVYRASGLGCCISLGFRFRVSGLWFVGLRLMV